jgi:RimJ/RimL family protein N-acetyltransferase
MEITPVILDGRRVRLEPLDENHYDGIVKAGAFEELWKWTNAIASTPETMRAYFDEAMRMRQTGTALPFATIDKKSNTIIGSTRFANADRANRRVEIGWTWITPSFQRSYVNSEAKYLMLRHAFETWNCARVELKTDVLNEKSRNAMKRIGAIEEGVLRKHVLTYSGRWRDSIYYSVLDTEWPMVRQRLEEFVSRES